jgi:hypothetical protein
MTTPRKPLCPTCNHLSACLGIDLLILFITRTGRDIFCCHGGHVILYLLRLYCRYFCVNMPLVGLYLAHERQFVVSFSQTEKCPYSSSLAFAGKYSAVTGATSSSTCSPCIAGSLSHALPCDIVLCITRQDTKRQKRPPHCPTC